VDFYFVRRTSKPFDQFNRFFAGGTACAENLNFLSYAHDVVLNAPLFELSVAFMGLGEIATSLRAVSRGQAFHSEAMTKNPTAPYMAA
jgi:hypothetical protein